MSNARVLVADDSVTIQKVFELAFEGEDIEIVVASDGKAALAMILKEKPDMIIADVNMPEMDGFELCQAVKKNPDTKSIPVYLLSSALDEFDSDKAKKAGASGKFEKPFRSEDMVGQVLAVISSPHAETEPAPSQGLDDSFDDVDVSLDSIMDSFDSDAGDADLQEALKSAWDEVEEEEPQSVASAQSAAASEPGGARKILDLTDNLAEDLAEEDMEDDLSVETLTGSETELELAEQSPSDSALKAFVDEEDSYAAASVGKDSRGNEPAGLEEDLSEEAREMLRAIDDEREILPEPPPLAVKPTAAVPVRLQTPDDSVNRAVKAALEGLDSSTLEDAIKAAVAAAIKEKITRDMVDSAIKSAIKEMSPLMLETFKKIVEEVTLDVAETLVRQTIDQIKSGE